MFKYLRNVLIFPATLIVFGCLSESRSDEITTHQFTELMQKLAHGWSTQNTEKALSCFSEDAIYMEPPDVQLYLGHEQLRPYFGALEPGTVMEFHNLSFDEEKQIGMGEYTFGLSGRPTADHGVVVVEIKNGKFAFWREYLKKGPFAFDEFLTQKGKNWQWHIGNYP